MKYVIDNKSYFVENTGYIFYIADYNVAEVFKPASISKTFAKNSRKKGTRQVQIVYRDNKVFSIPINTPANRSKVWYNSLGEPAVLVNTSINDNDMMVFPPSEFFKDIQDVIRMFIGGRRTEIDLQHTRLIGLSYQLDDKLERLGFMEEMPQNTRSAKYFLAKEMFKELYSPPEIIENVIEEFIVN